MKSWKIGQVSVQIGAAQRRPQRDPEADRASLRQVHETARAGDMDGAIALAEAALAGGLEHPMLLNLAAARQEREGRHEAALVLLERAHAAAPHDIGVRQALGLCLYNLERYDHALPHFDAVVAAQPDFGPVHTARGMALEARGDLRGAEKAYDRALALQPDTVPALAGMASLASRRGEHDGASVLAERVLTFAPGYPDALMTLASADLARGDLEKAENRLRGLIGDDRISNVQRALAEGLLGDVLDAQGRYAEAFGDYRACNEALHEAYRPRLGVGLGAVGYARETIALVDDAPAGAWTGRAEAPPGDLLGHVFLMGFPRSGTTLLEQVLASNPDVETLEERETLIETVHAYARRPDDLVRLATASDARLSELRRAYWARVRAEGADPAGKLFVDKHPLSTFKLPLIAKLFPQAKVLFARRDPRDVVLSCFRRRFAMSGPMYQLLTLQGCADYYDAAMRLGERLSGALPLSTHIVRHEALVEDFDTTVQAACAFLGLPWTASMRDFVERLRERGIATPSGAQLARGLSTDGIGYWRHYRDQIAPVLPTLQPWIERFGYPLD